MSATISNQPPAYIIQFECAGMHLSVSKADKAKSFRDLLLGDSIEFTSVDGKKITVTTVDKTATIFHNVVSSRTLVSTETVHTLVGTNVTSALYIDFKRFKSLSILQVIEILNLAYEPISNKVWDNHLQKFNPIDVQGIN